MRLTGVISLRGGGRFIDINHNEDERVEYILVEYSSYPTFSSEEDYFEYMATPDNKLISLSARPTPRAASVKYLDKWVSHYSWDVIKSELLILSKKSSSKDNILKYLAHPVRLEFLTTLAIKTAFNTITVVPNYPCDDEGIPTSTAGGGGNQGDIECFEDEKGILVEVTMSGGRTQTMMEVWPISRHLSAFSKKHNIDSMCHFVAPNIYADSQKQIQYVYVTEDLHIKTHSIPEFISYLEDSSSFYLGV